LQNTIKKRSKYFNNNFNTRNMNHNIKLLLANMCAMCWKWRKKIIFWIRHRSKSNWKAIMFYEVSPTKVSSLSFNTTHEDLCVKKLCISRKWNWKISCNKIFHLETIFNIIKSNSANSFLLKIKWDICEITSPIHE